METIVILEIIIINSENFKTTRTVLFKTLEGALKHFKYGMYTKEEMKPVGIINSSEHYYCSGLDLEGRLLDASIYTQEVNP